MSVRATHLSWVVHVTRTQTHGCLWGSWYGMTPLALAAGVHGHGNARIVNILLECGANPMQGVPLDRCKLMWQLRRQVTPDLRGSFALPPELVQPEGRRALGPAPIQRPSSTKPPSTPRPSSTPVPGNSSSGSGSTVPSPAPPRRCLYPLDIAAAAGNRVVEALLLQR